MSEFIVHVAYDDRDLRRMTNSPEIRDGDRQVLMNPAFAEFISKLGIKIITWKQLQKMKDENKLPVPRDK